MKVSIIIPTYNEEDVILKCLESLQKQSYKDFEIIIVDDGSADQTVELVKSFNVIHGSHQGAGAVRNLGAKSAKGEILVFVDADMTFDKHFIKNLIKPIDLYMKGLPAGRRGTFSKDEMVSNWDNKWARCWNINEGWLPKKRHPKKYPNKQKVFRAILKSEFDRVEGFTAGGYNDDWSLSEKLGYEADVAEKAYFYHKNPSSLKEIYNHAKWVGKRKYKFGILGYLIALLRSSFILSLIVGFYKSVINLNFNFLIFKIVYDFGVFIGIIKFMTSHNGAK